MLKCWNHSTTTRDYAVTYYKTLEKFPWHLGLKELKTWQTFSKSLKKIVKISSIKLRVLALGCSPRGGGGGGGGGMCVHRGADAEGGGGNIGVGVGQ